LMGLRGFEPRLAGIVKAPIALLEPAISYLM